MKKKIIKQFITKHLNTTFKHLEDMANSKLRIKIIPYTNMSGTTFKMGHMDTTVKPITMAISKQAFDENVVEEVVVHELCHLAVYAYYGDEGEMHGAEFKKYLNMAKKKTGLKL